MPVLTSMQDANWQEPRNAMLSNGPEMSGNRNRSRSQDDAMVGYYYQRPQMDVTQQYGNKRWAVGDDSVLEQVSDQFCSIVTIKAILKAFFRQLLMLFTCTLLCSLALIMSRCS